MLGLVEECSSNYKLLLGVDVGAHRDLKAAEECKTAAEVVDRRFAIVHQRAQGASFTVSDIDNRSEQPTSTSEDYQAGNLKWVGRLLERTSKHRRREVSRASFDGMKGSTVAVCTSDSDDS